MLALEEKIEKDNAESVEKTVETESNIDEDHADVDTIKKSSEEKQNMADLSTSVTCIEAEEDKIREGRKATGETEEKDEDIIQVQNSRVKDKSNKDSEERRPASKSTSNINKGNSSSNSSKKDKERIKPDKDVRK